MEKRFNEIIRNAPIIDYDAKLELIDMCKVLSIEFERLEGLDNRLIASLLRTRENDYSTALSQFVAVPHFRLDGEGKFYMVMLRCKDGIHFSSLYPSIKAVFAFASSREQRKMHLHALSRIVKITSQSSFQDRWLQAKGSETLGKIFIKPHKTITLKYLMNTMQ
ncbi:MAG: PTS sugar transporter subunit IIA [Candidatus Zixiibacteriota bacterium]